MAYKNIRLLIRVDCTPISDTESLSRKLRGIEGFYDNFSEYNHFKIGDTANFRNGTIKNMEPDELVYRYYKRAGGIDYVFDFTSRFFYVRLIGEEGLPAEFKDYYRIMEDAVKVVLENDKFVRIVNYGVGKEYVEQRPAPLVEDLDKIERDAYTSEHGRIRIICQKREMKDVISQTIVASVDEVAKNPNYEAGEKLYGQAFMNALKEAEEKYVG